MPVSCWLLPYLSPFSLSRPTVPTHVNVFPLPSKVKRIYDYYSLYSINYCYYYSHISRVTIYNLFYTFNFNRWVSFISLWDWHNVEWLNVMYIFCLFNVYLFTWLNLFIIFSLCRTATQFTNFVWGKQIPCNEVL